MGRVRVMFRKYDGSLHWNHWTDRLGEDEHGVWLGAGVAEQVWKGEVAWQLPESRCVLLIPRDGWWTGLFNAAPHRTEIYCDITTVPRWESPDLVTMVDLDLDVRRRRAGATELLDEDEFAEHRVRYGYPAEVVAAAEASAARLFDAVRDRVEPFDVAAAPWLARVT